MPDGYQKSKQTTNKFSFHTSVDFGAYGSIADIDTEWSVTTQETRTGTYLPNYRQFVKNHLNATTPMTGTRERFSCGSSSFYRICERPFVVPYGIYAQKTTGALPRLGKPEGFTGIASQTVADARAMENFVSSARRAQQALQGGVLAGELLKTIRLITDPAVALRKAFDTYLNDLRKCRGTVPKGHKRKFLRDRWLEARFGWLPLCSDIRGAMRALGEDQTLKPEFYKITGEGRDQFEAPLDPIFYNGISGTSCFQNVTHSEEWSVRYSGEMRSNVDKPSAQYKELVGVDGPEWLPTIWELIPYSFVADYFLNIGNVLEALALSMRASFAWKSVTTRSVLTRKTADHYGQAVVAFDDANDLHQQWGAAPGASEWEITSVNRGPHFGPVIPPLRFHLPTSGLKWLNLAALFTFQKSLTPY